MAISRSSFSLWWASSSNILWSFKISELAVAWDVEILVSLDFHKHSRENTWCLNNSFLIISVPQTSLIMLADFSDCLPLLQQPSWDDFHPEEVFLFQQLPWQKVPDSQWMQLECSTRKLQSHWTEAGVQSKLQQAGSRITCQQHKWISGDIKGHLFIKKCSGGIYSSYHFQQLNTSVLSILGLGDSYTEWQKEDHKPQIRIPREGHRICTRPRIITLAINIESTGASESIKHPNWQIPSRQRHQQSKAIHIEK